VQSGSQLINGPALVAHALRDSVIRRQLVAEVLDSLTVLASFGAVSFPLARKAKDFTFPGKRLLGSLLLRSLLLRCLLLRYSGSLGPLLDSSCDIRNRRLRWPGSMSGSFEFRQTGQFFEEPFVRWIRRDVFAAVKFQKHLTRLHAPHSR
jgi:hypothetical protein